jgi:lipopolysaccharide cholinephosphotransferase
MEKVSDLLLCGGETLRRVQLIQLEMLIEIDRVCRKHNLKYNIAFGSFLGAVRHKGFIPWDDDADINMPYEDYKRLTEIIDSEIDGEKYYFRFQDKEEDCNITFAHLKRNGTVYTKPNREGFKYHPGVFVDICPLFNGAPNIFLHVPHTLICWFFRTACWAHIGANSEKKFIKRLYYQQLAKIGNKKAYSFFLRCAAIFKKPSDKMAFFNGLDRSPYNIGFVKRECFDDPIEVEFEGHKFLAPPNIEDVLRYCYGDDYSLFPPVKYRRPTHKAAIDLGGLYSYERPNCRSR